MEEARQSSISACRVRLPSDAHLRENEIVSLLMIYLSNRSRQAEECAHYTTVKPATPPAKRSVVWRTISTNRKRCATGAAVHKHEVTFRPTTTSDQTPWESCILKFIDFTSIFD